MGARGARHSGRIVPVDLALTSAAQNGRVAQVRQGRPARRPSAEPLARTRRVGPALYVLILIGVSILLSVNHLVWLTLVMLGVNALMITCIVIISRQPADPWTGPRLRRPRD